MNLDNKNKSAKSRRFPLLLALTLFAYPFLHRLTISESSAEALHTWDQGAYSIVDSPDARTYQQPGAIKVLAEGFHSKITRPFVAVARNVETYDALTRLDENLPKLDAEFFKANVVVAAFLGQRNTGGYSVEITPSPVDINVFEKKPGKGVMVTQMITSPFKIVALQGVSNATVRLNLFVDDAWRQGIPFYRVSNGRFRMSGGFAGTSEEFGLEGFVGVMREGNLATFWFRIVASGTKKRRILMDCSTGLIDVEKKVLINPMSADSLVDQPNSGLAGTATFSEEGRKLTLNILPRPSSIADGYSGQGTIEAELKQAGAKP